MALTHAQWSAATVTHAEAPRFHLLSLLPPAELPMGYVPGDGKAATNNEGAAEGLVKIGWDGHCRCRLIRSVMISSELKVS